MGTGVGLGSWNREWQQRESAHPIVLCKNWEEEEEVGMVNCEVVTMHFYVQESVRSLKIYWKRAGIFAWTKMNRARWHAPDADAASAAAGVQPMKNPTLNLLFSHFTCILTRALFLSLSIILAGETDTEQWAGRHQGHQAGTLRRHTDYPAGDHNDAGLPPPEHHRLLRFVPAKGQAMDLHGVLWRWQPAGYIPGDGSPHRSPDRVHVPGDAQGTGVPALHGQDASGHQGCEYPADGVRRCQAGGLWGLGSDHGHNK